jgi:hypothetical protein
MDRRGQSDELPDAEFSNPFADEEPQKETVLTIRTTTLDTERFPDLENVQSVVLKDGPRVQKTGTYWAIRSRNTGSPKPPQLAIKTYLKRKDGSVVKDKSHSVTLTGAEDDEIQKLLDFLLLVHGGSEVKSSKDCVIRVPEGTVNAELLQELAQHLTAPEQGKVLADVLERAARDRGLFQVVLDRAARDPQLFAEAVAALNLARYKSALDEMKRLIQTNAREPKFQQLLEDNPWMFGSEYSERLDGRKLTRDEQQDFLLVRTTDGYVELVEIKTPLGDVRLFNYDSSHDCWYPCAEVTKVVAQVEKYLEEIDSDRYRIKAKDHIDPAKIRAKIIIGRDGDDAQRQALRRHNGHLHRIEVITFDQLVRIAERVLGYLDSALRLPSEALS